MLMKKITFNAPLNHNAYSYEPLQIEVEKVIPLYGKRFEQMREHPLEDAPEIIDNRDLMYMEGNTAHCILFLDANGIDGILVETCLPSVRWVYYSMNRQVSQATGYDCNNSTNWASENYGIIRKNKFQCLFGTKRLTCLAGYGIL